MAQSYQTRVVRVPKREQEIHVITNPADQNNSSGQPLLASRPSNRTRKRVGDADYEAPKTTDLRPNSHWLIVRRNLHRIRFMGYNQQKRDSAMPALYLGLQMKRELKRAQEEIKNIDKEENFSPVKRFPLTDENKYEKIYDTSHVQPNDALIYDRLGDEPLVLQNLLYYFSREKVSYGTLFWEFLNEVNRVLNMKRKRTVRVDRLRKLALTLAIILYCLIGVMFFLLIISVVTTATKMNDPEVRWVESNVETSLSTTVTLS